jgi:hypothetical protein
MENDNWLSKNFGQAGSQIFAAGILALRAVWASAAPGNRRPLWSSGFTQLFEQIAQLFGGFARVYAGFLQIYAGFAAYMQRIFCIFHLAIYIDFMWVLGVWDPKGGAEMVEGFGRGD